VTQGTALYGGEIAAAAAAHAARHGGAMRVQDFEAYSPEWVEPIGMDVYGHACSRSAERSGHRYRRIHLSLRL